MVDSVTVNNYCLYPVYSCHSPGHSRRLLRTRRFFPSSGHHQRQYSAWNYDDERSIHLSQGNCCLLRSLVAAFIDYFNQWICFRSQQLYLYSYSYVVCCILCLVFAWALTYCICFMLSLAHSYWNPLLYVTILINLLTYTLLLLFRAMANTSGRHQLRYNKMSCDMSYFGCLLYTSPSPRD